MNEVGGGSGFFCGLSPGLRQTWTLKKPKRQTSHLVEREALATPVQTCSFLRGMEQKQEATI